MHRFFDWCQVTRLISCYNHTLFSFKLSEFLRNIPLQYKNRIRALMTAKWPRNYLKYQTDSSADPDHYSRGKSYLTSGKGGKCNPASDNLKSKHFGGILKGRWYHDPFPLKFNNNWFQLDRITSVLTGYSKGIWWPAGSLFSFNSSRKSRSTQINNFFRKFSPEIKKQYVSPLPSLSWCSRRMFDPIIALDVYSRCIRTGLFLIVKPRQDKIFIGRVYCTVKLTAALFFKVWLCLIPPYKFASSGSAHLA